MLANITSSASRVGFVLHLSEYVGFSFPSLVAAFVVVWEAVRVQRRGGRRRLFYGGVGCVRGALLLDFDIPEDHVEFCSEVIVGVTSSGAFFSLKLIVSHSLIPGLPR
jgi:hypothetical protein